MIEIPWENACRVLIAETYDIEIHFNEDEEDENYDENCFYCPECGEPIYECDYPKIGASEFAVICPICDGEIDCLPKCLRDTIQKLNVDEKENNYEN